MVSVYTNHLRLEEIGTGEQSGDWGATTNTNLELIAEGFSYGTETIANSSTHTITMADGASDTARGLYLKCTGGGQACTVTLAPNTVSKVWMIENATSFTLTFSQGSGADVAISAGQVKMIATDGAGSSGAVYDLLTDVELAGTTTATALTVDDVAIDGKVITMTGSTGDTAVMTVGTDGTLTVTTTDTAAAAANITITADGTFEAAGTTVTLNSSGGITLDADGGTITFSDGGSSLGTITSSGYSGTAAVATTVTITDNESTNEDNAIIFTAGGDVDGGNIGLESDGTLTYNPSTGTVTATGFSGNLTGTLQTAAQGNVTSLGTLTALTVDDVAIDGKVITMTGDSSDTATITAGTNGTLSIVTTDASAAAANISITADGTSTLAGTTVTLDSSGDIVLDADGANVTIKDDGTSILDIANNSTDVELTVSTADKNFKIKGTDDSSAITALDIDMALAGKATFNGDVVVGGDLTISGDDLVMGTNTSGMLLIADGTNFNPTAISSLSEISTAADDDVLIAIDTSGGGLKKITRSAIIAVTGASGDIANVVEDTSPQLEGNLDTNSHNILIDDAHFIGDENGNEQIVFQTTSSAVNQIEVTNAASGSGVQIASTGGDTNIDLKLLPKGSGQVVIDGNVGIESG